MLDYLLAHGEPKDALAVFNVGGPTYELRDGSNYLNSTSDTLLDFVEQRIGIPLLPRNVDISASVDTIHQDWPGHSLSDAYLAGAPARVIGDMGHLIAGLKPSLASDTGDCFTPPLQGLGYITQQSFFALADPAAAGIKTAAIVGYAGAVAAAGAALDAGNKVLADISVTLNGISGLAHSTEPGYQQTNYDIVNRLYAGPNQKVDGETVQHLLQGSAVVLALAPDAPQPQPPQPAPPTQPTVPVGPAPGFSPGGGASYAPPAADVVAPVDVPAPVINPPIDDTYITTHWPVTGFYCNGDTTILTDSATTSYHPSSNFCNYLGGFSDPFWILRAYLLKGPLGNSTVVAEVGSNGSGKIYTDHGYDFSEAAPGDIYTVVLTEYNTNIGAQYNANLLPDFRSYITTGLDTNGVAQKPDLILYTIPFTYAP
ncbi:MAG: hypothetical protein V4474_03805 [Patescibacteria group bacterium]